MLVTSSNIRPFVHGIVERFRAQTPVLSQGEINPRAAEDCKQHLAAVAGATNRRHRTIVSPRGKLL